MMDGPGLQRELKLELSNPVANVYMSVINDAIESSVDGVTEVELRKLVPTWFLEAAVSGGVYERTIEDRPNARGTVRALRIWRARTLRGFAGPGPPST